LYKSIDGGKSVTPLARFSEQILSVYVSCNGTILVGVLGALYTSLDGGRSFTRTLALSSAESYIRFGKGFTEAPDGTLIIGEYGNISRSGGWLPCAYLYSSADQGITWKKSEFLVAAGVNKHVHFVSYHKSFNCVMLTDGDNKKQLWIGQACGSFDIGDIRWRLVNRRHIGIGGYLSIAESKGAVLFGTDYLGGTNFVVKTTDSRTFVKMIVPDPYRRNPIKEMVPRQANGRNEIWATLYSKIRHGTKGLLMYSANGGETWKRVVDYDNAAHRVSMVGDSNGPSDTLWLSFRDSENRDFVYRIVDREH
jgi:photosystem II stability/assembly factor-like uncharacterized protein